MRRLLASFGVAAVIFCASAALTQAESEDPPAILGAKARQILAAYQALSGIWPGYWPPEQGFVLYDPTHGAVLVGSENRPGSITYKSGELPGADTTFVYDYPTGTPNTMLITVGKDWSHTLSTLFHEQFHDYQSDAFDKSDRVHSGDYVELSAIPDRAAFTAAAELERRVLADAILAQAEDQRLDLTRRYLTLRRAREATVGVTITDKERYRERTEGSAEYVGLTAKAMVLGHNVDSVAKELAEGLRRSLFANPEGSYTGNWFRTRAYSVGGAMALLLGKSTPGWQARIENGESLDAVLADTVVLGDDAEQRRVVAETRARYGAEMLLRQVSIALANAPDTLENTADFLKLADRHIVLELTVPRDRLSEGRQFSSTKEMIAVGRSATAFLNVDDFKFERAGVTLQMQGHSIMTELLPSQQPAPITRRLTIPITDQLVVPAFSGLPLGQHTLDTVSVKAAGFALQIDGPVKVHVSPSRILLSTSVPPR